MVIINAIMGLKGGKAEAQLGICGTDFCRKESDNSSFIDYDRSGFEVG